MPYDVVVLGSANLDQVLRVDRIPAPGETVLSLGRETHPGGKGLNQAVAAARAGARTAFVGAVGRDEAGEQLLTVMQTQGIGVTAVARVDQPSGVALIVVAGSGENTIVVDAGANATLASLGPAAHEALSACSLLVAQLEVPLSGVAEGAAMAQDAGATVLLNAAPAQPIPGELLDLVDVLVVNEHEAMTLTGATDVETAIGLLAGPARDVVVTLGSQGAVLAGRDGGRTAVPAVPARVVDTTGAGDAFVGSLAASLAGGAMLADAVARAVAAGSLAVEQRGAVPSMPTYDEVSRRLRGS